MNKFLSIKLDKNEASPIYQQIGDAFCKLIEDGILKPNTKLPPIRKIAKALKVNNVTIISAYKYLENKNVVHSIMGSGTYVKPSASNKLEIIQAIENNNLQIEESINFASGTPSGNLFPVKHFKKIFNQVLDKEGANAFILHLKLGDEFLRKSIAKYLEDFKIKTTCNNIQVKTTVNECLELICKLLFKDDDVMIIEQPTNINILGIFILNNAKIIEVPIEKDGIDIIKLESKIKIYKPKLIYVMTYFQTPTGISYSKDKKEAILKLASKYNFYILEEDKQCEFNYTEEVIIPLKAIDYEDRVIYLKNFSKLLTNAVRLSILVLPDKIMTKNLEVEYVYENYSQAFIQRALGFYFESSLWKEHVKNMKNTFSARYETMKVSIEKYLYECVTYDEPKGGLNFWLKINCPNNEIMFNELIENNIIVTDGSIFYQSKEKASFINLSFADVNKDKIEEGIRMLGKVMQKYL